MYTILSDDRIYFREAIVKSVIAEGFGFVSADDENALNKFLYTNDYWHKNEAYNFISELINQNLEQWYISILYNKIPDHITKRFEQMFINVYPSAQIKYFKELRIPEGGILFYVYTGPY